MVSDREAAVVIRRVDTGARRRAATCPTGDRRWRFRLEDPGFVEPDADDELHVYDVSRIGGCSRHAAMMHTSAEGAACAELGLVIPTCP